MDLLLVAIIIAINSLQFSSDKLVEKNMTVTAYSTNCPIQRTGNRTASGTNASKVQGIAVDPKVIPLGTNVLIDGKWYLADDTGSKIKGNRIDIRLNTRDECIQFGVQKKTVYYWRK